MNRTRVNVSDLLSHIARQRPDDVAVAIANGRKRAGQSRYRSVTFAELEQQVADLARGLVASGVVPGTRLAMLVPCGIEFVALVFALLRSGAVTVLVDPGLGRRQLVDCLAATRPEGFVAIPAAHAVRQLLRFRFRHARRNVTVGRRWFWSGHTLASLSALGREGQIELPDTTASDPAAIVFTSGSTGPAKGVLYRHEVFAEQVRAIRDQYGIQPGEVDLACFPLFGLFNAAMGTTTVFPEMDFSRPARANPQQLVETARDWNVTQAFASPAVWDRVSRHCERTGQRVESLRRIFSCGAPVPAAVLARTLEYVSGGEAEMHTPYGATEALPVATIEAQEVLAETACQTDAGAGVCVGRPFESIAWQVIPISDDPIQSLAHVTVLPIGEIGELIVAGPQVSSQYVTRTECNPTSKIPGDGVTWHRMGDVGYLDGQGRFWYCGRKSQRVVTADGVLFTTQVESVFNTHAEVRRSALTGCGTRPTQVPVVWVERPSEAGPPRAEQHTRLVQELRQLGGDNTITQGIETFHFTRAMPVDIRHNSKINRERLAIQAQWVHDVRQRQRAD